MNDRTILTDANLEAMLARRAGKTAPAGLAESIEAALAGIPDGRRPWRSYLTPPPLRTPGLRLAWVIVLVGLLMAAAVSAVFVGSQLLRHTNRLAVVPPPSVVPIPSAAPLPSAGPVALVARPIEQINHLAFGADGSLWLATAAGVVHWDIASASATLYDQHDVLPTTDVSRVVVAPDGTVWAGQNWLAHFDGAWTVDSQQGDLGSLGVTGNLGGMAVARDGTLWIAAGSPGEGSKLLRYNGAWTAIDVPDSIAYGSNPWAVSLDVTPDGAVLANTFRGVARYDGTTWTSYSKTSTGLPRTPSLAAVAPDGHVWAELSAEGCEQLTADSPVTCTAPAAGVARFDGTHWTAFTTADGLADNDARLFLGSDGTVWTTYGSLPRTISRFDGTRWVSAQVPELGGARPLAAAPDGALWLASASGLLRYDGVAVTSHPFPALETPANLPPLTLTPAPGQTVTQSALGTITWRVYEADPQHVLWPVGTAHGPVTLDGPDFRWLSPSGAWDGTILPITGGWGVAAAGDDAIVYGQGAARLSWDGARWVPGRALELPAAVGFVLRVAAGPRGTILTGGTSVASSTDGVHFAEAVRGPVWTAPGTGASGTAGPAGIGPVLATQDGFVALVTRGPVSGRWDPLLEPRLSFSPDGSTWSLVSSTSPFGQGSYVRDVAGRDGRYVAIGNVGGERGPWAVWVSDDGLSWELLPTLKRAAPCATVNGVTACIDNLFAGVAAGTSGWVICSWDGAAWASADGRAWEPLRGWPGVSGGYAPPFVALGPGVVVASGQIPGPWHDVVVVGTIEP